MQRFVSTKVVVIQRRMTHYRVAFFESLRKQLEERGLELVLAYGLGTEKEERKNDGGQIAWAKKLPTHYLLGGRICYQPLGDLCEDAAMLVVTPENKLVCNLWHQFAAVRYKVALWGHGANLQGNAASWREKFKRRVARRADWWFGYTEHSTPLIAQSGFPEDRITVLNNTIDTAEMRSQFEAIRPPELAGWRAAHGLGDGPVGMFLGSLYKEKRIDFLLDAAKAIHAQVPGFELLIVGAGPQKSMVEAFCKEHAWAHFAGMLKGQDKVLALASATVMLNPGLVGLGILDSFVCEVPMVTTDCGLHSPEIVYLQSGINGLMTNNTLNDYVRECVALMTSPTTLAAMKAACKSSASNYTVENMARNFADGVEQCLQSPSYPAKAAL
jgi:glycosyltransferase involved in cell wall biosynthesis